MTSRTRYPGAQPFADDPFSSRLFFGREQASKILTDQILANRMLVVYAKSGLGKTSLLNAGVAPMLREEDTIPLIVRVNDVERGPLQSVFGRIRTEAERQQVEYVEGSTDSLWSFFKTVEFWRGDLLLTPVLIIDQFEELFNLQSLEARAAFLSELSYLVRGVQPPEAAPSPELSAAPPNVHVVLSLREDYLGLLEEAADHLPQIFDHRFRLAPLTTEEATRAMTGPASIEGENIQTRPFSFDSEAVNKVVTYLARRRRKVALQTTQYVEPFQLQLVCQRFEQIVAELQQKRHAELTVTLKDIGGEPGIRKTLQNFYQRSVKALPGWRTRRTVRRLCQEFLISPEGRRMSLEEDEIQGKTGLAPEVLRQLVASRLLRVEVRADSSYYELSHDALVEPVLATRRRSALFFGWTGLGVSVVVFLLTVFMAIGALIGLVEKEGEGEEPFGIGEFVGAIFILSVFLTLTTLWLRKSQNLLRRYRTRAYDEFWPVRVTHPKAATVLGAVGMALAGFLMIATVTFGILIVTLLVNAYTDVGPVYPDFRYIRDSIQENGLGLDTVSSLITVPVLLMLWTEIFRYSVRTFLHAPPVARQSPPADNGIICRLRSGLGFLWAATCLFAAVVLLVDSLVLSACVTYLGRELPGWLPQQWFNALPHDCEEYSIGSAVVDMASTLIFCWATARLFARSLQKIREPAPSAYGVGGS